MRRRRSIRASGQRKPEAKKCFFSINRHRGIEVRRFLLRTTTIKISSISFDVGHMYKPFWTKKLIEEDEAEFILVVPFLCSSALPCCGLLQHDASSTRREMYEVVVYSLLSQRMCSFKETKLRSQSAARGTTTDRACVYCWV